MQHSRRPYRENEAPPAPLASGPYVSQQQNYHPPSAGYNPYGNPTNNGTISNDSYSNNYHTSYPMPPPAARRPSLGESSANSGGGMSTHSTGNPPPSAPSYGPPPGGYAPPRQQMSRPPVLDDYPPPALRHHIGGANYDSDVSSMATPVATPDAQARYRQGSAFSPDEHPSPPSPPPPAPLYPSSPGRDLAGDKPPLMHRPKSYLALPVSGDMDYSSPSGGYHGGWNNQSTGNNYPPPPAPVSYPAPPAIAPPPARSRTVSASSVNSATARMDMPPPPPMSNSPGRGSQYKDYKDRSMDASAAMHNVYSRSVQQSDPGSPGSRGKGSRGQQFFPPPNPQGSPGRSQSFKSYSINNNINANVSGGPASPGGKSLASNRNRIDPTQLPRPPPPPKNFVYHTRAGLGRKVPPVSNSVFQCVDTGNCSPRFVRVTTGAPPTTSSLAYKLGVPLALVATPFASPENGEDTVPVIEMIGDDHASPGPEGHQCNPIRCSRCKGYMNPFVTWLSGGQKWACNLCHMVNETPPWYFCSLDGSGQRVDKESRPELSRGSVDFAVNSDYCVRSPQESIFVFCIDVSERAVSCGLTTATMQSVAKVLQELYDSESPARVGIISFSKGIQFYSVRPEHPEPFGICSVSATDPFCPLPSKLWILPVHENLDVLKSLLWRLPELHANIAERDGIMGGYSNNLEGSEYAAPPVSCPMATLVAAADGLVDIGGKVHIFTPNHSVSGVGSLSSNREYMSGSIYGTPAELGLYGCLDAATALMKNRTSSKYSSSLAKGGSLDVTGAALITGDLSPTGVLFGTNSAAPLSDSSPMSCFPEKAHVDDKETLEGYLLFADWCGKHNIATDVYMTMDGNRHKDISLFAEISRRTGGSLHPISGSLLKESAVFTLQQELSYGLTSIAASEAVLKLRCSAGFRADDYTGQGRMSETATEAEIAWLNNDFTFVYTFVHDGNLKEDDPAYLQLAILHTSVPGGRRLVRVHNMHLSCTATSSQVFRNADLDCVATTLFKTAIDKALKLPLTLEKSGPREFLTKCVFDILYGYRTNCSAESPKSQLILPESLKVLPLYVMAMLKHPALLENASLNNGGSSRGGGANRPFISGAERSFELSRLQALPVRETIRTLYPRLFALHSLRSDDGTVVDLGSEEVQLPRGLPCSSEVLDSSGMYLLDDGTEVWLYIGRNVPVDELDDIFEPNPAVLRPEDRPLTEISFRTDGLTDFPLPLRISNIISALQKDRVNVPRLKILWADAPHSAFLHRFSLRLVEDSLYGNMSYVDYLVKTHAKIQAKL